MCYPGGRHNDRVVSISQDNYRFGIIVKDALYTTGDDPFRIPRYVVRRGMTMEEFTGILESIEYSQAG